MFKLGTVLFLMLLVVFPFSVSASNVTETNSSGAVGWFADLFSGSEEGVTKELPEDAVSLLFLLILILAVYKFFSDRDPPRKAGRRINY